MRAAICTRCGGPKEQPDTLNALCYGCHLDDWVPPGFALREEYARDLLTSRFNARRRPQSGLAVLDAAPPPRVVDAAESLSAVEIEHLGEREAGQGIDDWAALFGPEL